MGLNNRKPNISKTFKGAATSWRIRGLKSSLGFCRSEACARMSASMELHRNALRCHSVMLGQPASEETCAVDLAGRALDGRREWVGHLST
jgi:hypothetical protein